MSVACAKPARTADGVERLIESGALRRAYLRPLEWGGLEDPRNVALLPPGAIRQKEAFEARVLTEVKRGATIEYSAHAEYRGDDRIPVKVVLTALGQGVELRETIDVDRYLEA